MFVWASIAGVLVVAFLGWNLYRRFGADHIAKLNDGRRATSRMVSRGELVDGNRHLAVAMAVTESTFFYENTDMQASLDLEWIREIEYDTSLATGAPVHGGRVLRLRTDSQVFEFVLPADDVSKWYLMLPPRQAARRDFTAPQTVAAT